MDSGYQGDPYKVDIPLAGCWMYDIWDRLQFDIIYNCWSKSQII